MTYPSCKIVILALSSCATLPEEKVDPQAAAVLDAMSSKLADAKTLRVTARRTASPGFHVGLPVGEKVNGVIVVRRPNQLTARMERV